MMVGRITLALALVSLVSAAGADELETHHVTVYGTASLQVVPDQMRWHLNVRNIRPTSAAVVQEHSELVDSVLTFLKQSQVAEGTIQTSHMQLGEKWSDTRGSSVRVGYFASTDLDFTLTDFTRYSAIWIGLSAFSNVTVRGIDMDHTERIRFQNEARVKAVLAARDKAEGIAEALGARLGEPLVVEEDLSPTERWWQQSFATNIASSVGEPATVEESLAPGSITVRARVRAVFGLLAQQ